MDKLITVFGNEHADLCGESDQMEAGLGIENDIPARFADHHAEKSDNQAQQ